jgi:MoaA/NifB/PqqE/SkfB family radical SAM enzyme
MKAHQRFRSLLRTPRLLWDAAVRGRYDFTFDLMPMNARRLSAAKRLNLIRAGANLAWRRATAWSWPLHMQFELTNYCNLRCPVCPTGAGTLRRPAQAMAPELFGRLFDAVGPYLLSASLWGWGEPLLHPELRRILQTATKYPVATLLSTNGQNLDNESVVEALLDHPPVYLIVALDGITDEVNARFRVGARLAPALAGVRKLAEGKRQRRQALPVLHLRFMVMRHNEPQVPAVPSFAAEHGFELLTFRTLNIVEGDEQVHRDIVPTQEKYQAYRYEGGQRVERNDFVCLHPFWFPTVFADGTVVACEQDHSGDLPLGRVNGSTTFADVWTGAQARALRRCVRSDRQSLAFCRHCPFADHPETSGCSVEAVSLADLAPALAALAGRA